MGDLQSWCDSMLGHPIWPIQLWLNFSPQSPFSWEPNWRFQIPHSTTSLSLNRTSGSRNSVPPAPFYSDQSRSLRQHTLVIEEKQTPQRLALDKIIKYIIFVSAPSLSFSWRTFKPVWQILLCLPFVSPCARCVGYKQFAHSLVREADIYTTNSNWSQTLWSANNHS